MQSQRLSTGLLLAGLLIPLAARGDHVLFQSTPQVVEVATFGPQVDLAEISDVEPGDFDDDGACDFAVAWFVTDFDDRSQNLRRLTVFWGGGALGLERGDDVDLYVPDPNLDELAIFRNGSADVAPGDFDGDGDLDIAVTAFFGDELWILENLGSRHFVGHVKFPYVFNTTGNFQTPPEAHAADFDRDGRDDLVYIADPTLHVLGLPLHFWKTESDIASMERVEWTALIGAPFAGWTRSLAIGDYDGDGRIDLCYSGSANPLSEDAPILVFWYAFDPASESFLGHSETPGFVVSDVATIRSDGNCRDGIVCSDRDGAQLEFFSNRCSGSPDLTPSQTIGGYAATSPNRGMPIVVADLDLDGRPDIVSKQRLGSAANPHRIEITLASSPTVWTRLAPTPISTMGLGESSSNTILRPRALAVADLVGGERPEIIAGFAAAGDSGGAARQLRIGIWSSLCRADVDGDGDDDLADLATLLGALACEGSEFYRPGADLNHDLCVDLTDLSMLLSGFGCAE